MKLTPEQQKLLVSLLLSDYSLYARAKPALRPEYFDASLQPTIKYIEDYTNRYSVLPLTDQMEEALEELGDVYSEEELRIVRLKFICEVAN